MNVIILKNNLKEGLSILSGIKKESSQLPILKNILLEARDDKVYVTATDLEIAVIHGIPAKILEKGSVAIPFSVFLQIIQNISSERIHLEKEGTVLRVYTDNYTAKIATTAPDDFPIIPSIEESKKQHVVFDVESLLDGCSSVMNASQVSDFRPELSGVLLHMLHNTFRFVATDSFRLAKKEYVGKKIETSFNDDDSFIIPLKTVQEVVRIFSNEKGTIRINCDMRQVLFETESTTLISRLIEGNFPDYELVIPKEFDTKVTCQKDEFISALKVVSSLSNRLHEVRLEIDEDLKHMKLLSSSHEVGESEHLLTVKVEGKPLSLSFNWKFLFDGLKHVSSDTVFFGFNSEQKPSLIQSPQDETYVYVITSIKSG